MNSRAAFKEAVNKFPRRLHLRVWAVCSKSHRDGKGQRGGFRLASPTDTQRLPVARLVQYFRIRFRRMQEAPASRPQGVQVARSSLHFPMGVWLAAVLITLGGCASTLSARVTTYQQWPIGAQGEYYRIVPASDQSGNLQFAAFSDMLRASIGPIGLREAVDGVQPRFDVRMEYGNPVKQTWVQRYNDGYFYDGWMGPAFGGYYGGWGRWGGGVFFTPSVINVPVNVYQNTLTVTLSDQEDGGREVYRATAVHTSETDNLDSVMPYLMQAIFDDFPGNNGQVREVRYELPR